MGAAAAGAAGGAAQGVEAVAASAAEGVAALAAEAAGPLEAVAVAGPLEVAGVGAAALEAGGAGAAISTCTLAATLCCHQLPPCAALICSWPCILHHSPFLAAFSCFILAPSASLLLGTLHCPINGLAVFRRRRPRLVDHFVTLTPSYTCDANKFTLPSTQHDTIVWGGG